MNQHEVEYADLRFPRGPTSGTTGELWWSIVIPRNTENRLTVALKDPQFRVEVRSVRASVH